MSEKYIESTEISVYPSARRGVEYPESRLVTETALAGIVNRLIDKEGFIISNNMANNFEFNIFGYYFNVKQCSYITNLFPSPSELAEGTTIYGVITLAEVSDNITELSGQDGYEDTVSVYKGIGFTTDQPSGDNVKYLKLLRVTSGAWGIVAESKFKFDATSSEAVNVDGGIIL